MKKYIYILNIKFQGIIKNAYLDEDIFNEIYFNIDDAIQDGKELLKERLNKHAIFMKIDIEDIMDIIDYSFEITQVSCNAKEFSDIEYLEKYYYENLDDNRNNIYDYLLSLVDTVKYVLDIDGNIIYTYIDKIYDGFDIRYFDYNKKYHLENFKIGDKVKPKNHFEGCEDKVYEIFDIINKDTNILESDDPLYFRQGYALTDIYNDYCNKGYGLHFDEELIKVSDQEYFNYYKDWDWYGGEDGWEVVETYGEYINKKLNKVEE